MVDQKTTTGTGTKGMTAQAALEMAKNGKAAVFEERDENGFLVVNDKEKLVGQTFTIVDTKWDIRVVDGGRGSVDRVYVYAVLGNEPIVFTDTSQGVQKQIGAYKGDFPVLVQGGLRVSEYSTQNGGTAKTYYLNVKL